MQYRTVTPHGTYVRKSQSLYTHIVVALMNGVASDRASYCGSLELAEAAAKRAKRLGFKAEIYAVGIADNDPYRIRWTDT